MQYNKVKIVREARGFDGETCHKGKTLGEGKPLVCVPVMESSIEAVVEEIKYLAESGADMIEWRVDAFEHFRDCNAVRAVFEQTAPVLTDKIFLYTFRSRQQGGLAEITPETLSDLHELAAESDCVDLVDMEFLRRKIRFGHCTGCIRWG